MDIIEGDETLTKSVRVSRALARDIFEGVYRPGQRLVRRSLCKQYGVSLSIVNEALGQLTTDGLVEIPARESARVVAFTEKGLRGNFLLREAVECQVMRLLAEEASDETLNHLLRDAQALDQWIETVGVDSAMHLEFHLKLARATEYSCLETALKRSGVRQLLTSRWLRKQAHYHPRDFHEKLVRSLFERNPDLAEAKMREHLRYGDATDVGVSLAGGQPADG